jgi:hypothetical protein
LGEKNIQRNIAVNNEEKFTEMTSADRSLAKMDNTNILNAFIIQQNQQ